MNMLGFLLLWLDSLLGPIQVGLYLLFGLAVYQSYKKNKKFVLTKFVKITIVIIAVLWISSFLYFLL